MTSSSAIQVSAGDSRVAFLHHELRLTVRRLRRCSQEPAL